MKTEKELQQLKEEIERLSEKLKELSEEELKMVSGGTITPKRPSDPAVICTLHESGNCTWTKETREESCAQYKGNPGCWCIWDYI